MLHRVNNTLECDQVQCRGELTKGKGSSECHSINNVCKMSKCRALLYNISKLNSKYIGLK